MKIELKVSLEKLGKNFYYFEVCGIPHRVWKNSNKKWMICVFSGVKSYEYDSIKEAVDDAILTECANDSYRQISAYLIGY